MTTSSIPQARDILNKLIVELEPATQGAVSLIGPSEVILRVNSALMLMTRRPATRKAPKRLKPLSDEDKMAIRVYARDVPEASQLDIAVRFGTNPGRVSEALAA